jgi:hypothetical protein
MPVNEEGQMSNHQPVDFFTAKTLRDLKRLSPPIISVELDAHQVLALYDMLERMKFDEPPTMPEELQDNALLGEALLGILAALEDAVVANRATLDAFFLKPKG